MRYLLICLCLCFAASVRAQTPAESKDPYPSLDNTKATVYIYKTWHASTLWRAAFAVYLDDNKMIARLDRGIYLVAVIPAGRHEFSTKDKRSGGIAMDFQAGQVYFLRLSTDSGAQVTHPKLTIPAKEEYEFDLKHMKPIEEHDIKDKTIVQVPGKK